MSSIAIILDEKGALTALTDDASNVGFVQVREDGKGNAHNETTRNSDGPQIVEMISEMKCEQIVATHFDDASLDAAQNDGITAWLAPPKTDLSTVNEKIENEELTKAKHVKGAIEHPNAPKVDVPHEHRATVERHDIGHSVTAPAKGATDPY